METVYLLILNSYRNALEEFREQHPEFDNYFRGIDEIEKQYEEDYQQ